MEINTHLTKILAYAETLENLGAKQTEVLKALKDIGRANNRMIAEYMHRPINTITPRILELRKLGLVKEAGSKTDYKTNRLTIFWEANLL